MKAAERLFTARRFHEITVEEIADAANVGKGTVYLYFNDKEDIFFHTATSGFDELCFVLQSGVDSTLSFEKQLLTACGQIRNFFEQRHALFRLMQVEEARLIGKQTLGEKWREHRKKLVRAVAEILEQGVTTRQLRNDIPTQVLAQLLLGLLRTQARDLADAPETIRHHSMIVNVFLLGAGRHISLD